VESKELFTLPEKFANSPRSLLAFSVLSTVVWFREGAQAALARLRARRQHTVKVKVSATAGAEEEFVP
jgi:hypothetical protein